MCETIQNEISKENCIPKLPNCQQIEQQKCQLVTSTKCPEEGDLATYGKCRKVEKELCQNVEKEVPKNVTTTQCDLVPTENCIIVQK